MTLCFFGDDTAKGDANEEGHHRYGSIDQKDQDDLQSIDDTVSAGIGIKFPYSLKEKRPVSGIEDRVGIADGHDDKNVCKQEQNAQYREEHGRHHFGVQQGGFSHRQGESR